MENLKRRNDHLHGRLNDASEVLKQVDCHRYSLHQNGQYQNKYQKLVLFLLNSYVYDWNIQKREYSIGKTS